MRTSFLILFLLLLSGCASNTISYVKKGEFVLSQGRFGIKSWEDDLKFVRTSYLSGMTMVFDIMVSDSIKGSKFQDWLSPESKKEVNNCSYPFVIGIFLGRDFKVNNHDVFRQVLGSSGKFLDSYEFVKNFSFHPSYGKNSFNIYRFELVCLEKEGPVIISLPGFETTRVN
tara:strand:- start:161 stop:673 length:513 start_codon:yes stop_codon:yes gene_type:complete